jgi:hypothetical protein
VAAVKLTMLLMLKTEPGVVVPMPTEPLKYALPVVVAPPLMVRPVVVEPPPIVVEPYIPRPVVVAFPGKRYEKDARFKVPPSATVPPPEVPPEVLMVIEENWSWLLPMVEEATTEPFALTERSVFARPEMAKEVVVALVVVELLAIVFTKYEVDDA